MVYEFIYMVYYLQLLDKLILMLNMALLRKLFD